MTQTTPISTLTPGTPTTDDILVFVDRADGVTKRTNISDFPISSGDVTGPASATDGAPALFNGTSGKVLKNSTPTGTGNPVLQTSPTLTTPRFADLGFIADSNGNEMLAFNSNASAVNYLELENGTTTNPPHLRSKGDDTNIGLHLVGKGTGEVSVCDAVDETKRIRFGVSNNGTGIITTLRSNSTGTSKTIDLPNATTTLAGLSNAQTFSGVNTFSTGVSMLLPQGYMINGRISVSVASNDITLTLLTAGGSTPSATDPVFCRIGDTVRTVTSALSVTLNDGTNWFNSGATNLATFEIDYFAYLGYNATDGVTIGFARIPYASQYSQFSTTSTNERYLAVSNRTNASANDNYEVIGRFGATLSATASFLWSVPTYTPLNLIQHPIYETRWLTFLPTITYNGTAPSGSELRRHRYKIQNEQCILYMHSEWSTAGTGITTVTATTPIEEVETFFTDGLHGGLNIGTGSGYGAGNGSTVQLRGRTTRTFGSSINANTFVLGGVYQILGT